MSSQTRKCPFCGAEVSASVDGSMTLATCDRCGQYSVSPVIFNNPTLVPVPLYLLAGSIRNRYEETKQPVTVSEEFVRRAAQSHESELKPIERIDLLLSHVMRKCVKPTQKLVFDSKKDYPLVYAENPAEFRWYCTKAIELGLLETEKTMGGQAVGLSLKGWERADQLRRTAARPDQAFVAMWFDKSLDEAWEQGFRKALKETGYRELRIDKEEHNEKICDRILAEIKRSGLFVGDFTGNRSGVYFEAGFAMGLGLPVIWTCREDCVEQLHFDTRQYNHVVWTDPSDLAKKLRDRIEATLPSRTNAGHP